MPYSRSQKVANPKALGVMCAQGIPALDPKTLNPLIVLNPASDLFEVYSKPESLTCPASLGEVVNLFGVPGSRIHPPPPKKKGSNPKP